MFSGCSDSSSRPTDLPPLFPCTVLVIQGGVPLAEAFVEFHPEGDSQKYWAAAYTDANGKATMLTYGYPGVPVGKYKILVSKIIEDNLVNQTNGSVGRVLVSANRYALVNSLHSNPETTPHEIEITTKRTPPITVDVGEPVREKRGSAM